LTTSLADFFAQPKLNAARWLKAAQSGAVRVLPEDETATLASRIADDKKQFDRLMGLLRRLSPVQTMNSASTAVLDLANRVLRSRVPEVSGQAKEVRTEIVLEAIDRLNRDVKPGRELHIWLEATLLAALLNKVAEPEELPGLARAAFAPSQKAPKSLGRRGKGGAAGRVVLYEEVSFFLSCLGKPAILSSALVLQGIYRRRMSDLEDSRARVEMQLSERMRECAHLKAELVTQSNLVKERDDAIQELAKERQDLQAAWDAQRTQALHRIETLRGRIQGLLKGDLTLWLETARDAATASPPRIGVITERLERAIERAAKEAQWLASSDST
jgi:hypothetical protein